MADVANAGLQRGEGRAAATPQPAATLADASMPGGMPARREATGLLGHLPLYLATAAGLAVSSFVLQDQLAALGTDGPQALVNPLAGGLWAAALVIALYLGLIGAVSLARERERGTLEV